MNKIEEIAKNISKLNELELSQLSEVLLTNHRISATIYRFGVDAVIDNSKKSTNLYLISAGYSKLETVKFINHSFGIGLKNAKDIVDKLPSPSLIAENVSDEIFEIISNGLSRFDAVVELR